MRFMRGGVRGPLVALKSYAPGEKFKDQLSRDFLGLIDFRLLQQYPPEADIPGRSAFDPNRICGRHRYREQSLQHGFRIAEASDAAKEGDTATRHSGFRPHRVRT
jgi:hypothetical protein